VWKSTVDGEVLHFRLVGVNNQNLIMEDEETGTWWQQVTGEALLGPLQGRRLEWATFEQLTYEVWARENPGTTVLEPYPEFADRYWPEAADDDPRTGDWMPFPVEATPGDRVEQGELIVAVKLPHGEKAYPMRLLREQSPVTDSVGGRDILLVVAADGRSVRCFDRSRGDQKMLELFRKPDIEELRLVDTNTGSEWDFTGTAITGPLAGQVLERWPIYFDYWFDWRAHHPEEPVYTAGMF